MNAPAAARSWDTMDLRVGMTSIPVSVFNETTSENDTELVSTEGNPVGTRYYDKVTDQNLARTQTVSMTKTKFGPVQIDRAEIGTQPDKGITIQGMMPLDELGQFRVRAYRSIEPAQIGTKGGKRDRPHAQQQLSALLAAMAGRAVFAYGQFITRGQSYPVAILPDGLMVQFQFDQNVRQRRESRLVEPPADMLAESEALVDRLLVGDAKPDLVDHRRAEIMALAEAKAQVGPAPDVDSLMADLQASIDRQKAKVA